MLSKEQGVRKIGKAMGISDEARGGCMGARNDGAITG
jgi:hypothetical protein